MRLVLELRDRLDWLTEIFYWAIITLVVLWCLTIAGILFVELNPPKYCVGVKEAMVRSVLT